MPRDSLKWRVNEAVQNSALPPPARLIMLVLSDMADSNTGEIPAKQKVSVTELVRRTGLKETTVKTHRALLERLGWIVILRPTAAEAARHVPSRYRIAVGANPTGGRETTPETSPRGSGDDPRNVDRGSGDDPAGGRETTTAGVGRRPPSYYYDRNDQYDQLPGADAHGDDATGTLFDAHPAETAQSRSGKKTRGGTRKQTGELKPPSPADELTNAFWAKHGKGQAQSWVAIRGVLRTCLANEVPRDDLARALDLLANEETSISGGTIQNALKRLRQTKGGTVVPFQRNGHTAFRDDPDRDYSLDAYLRERNGA